MSLLLKLPCCLILFLLGICPKTANAQAPDIFNYFRQSPRFDTLRIEVLPQSDSETNSNRIPNTLFFTSIPQELLQQIDYIVDSAQAQVFGHLQFALTDNIVAYWVEIRQFWFQHHTLLLYNKTKSAFTDRVTVAEFYGGDGAQVLIGSWLFDYDGDGNTDILRRDIQHSIIPGAAEMEERTEHSAGLLLWRSERFEPSPLPDTAAAIRLFPISGF